MKWLSIPVALWLVFEAVAFAATFQALAPSYQAAYDAALHAAPRTKRIFLFNVNGEAV